MNGNQINLEEISKIPEDEFREHFQEWLDRDEVARSLQAKLRKDLIDNFNKTKLGRKLFLQNITTQRLLLSPLILTLNTLVAEFLYAQNCHFTLSVLCTEVPYRNTLPDFESMETFRFTEGEIMEIFEAININFNTSLKSEIVNSYLTEEEGRVSLLHIIFKHIFKVPREDIPFVHQDGGEDEVSERKDVPKENVNTNFHYLNRYLMILSKKVKEMSNNLEKRDGKDKKSLEARKFDSLNKSLMKLSESMKHMAVSKRKNKKVACIISAIQKMSESFEKCADRIHNIDKDKARTHPDKEKTYEQWIHEMRSTVNGQKFLGRIETSLAKAIKKEKVSLETDFRKKLEEQTQILKLKFKQKILEERKEKKVEEVPNTLERKIDEMGAKQKEFIRILSEDKERKSQSPIKSYEPKPSLAEIVKNITSQDRHLEQIVFDAKLRIQKLDYESKEIDRSFQKYLDRHKTFRAENEKSANAVWESYKVDKKALEQKCKSIKKSLQEAHQHKQHQQYHHQHPPRVPLKSIHHFPNEMNNDKNNDDVVVGDGRSSSSSSSRRFRGTTSRRNSIIGVDEEDDVIRETKQLMVDNERKIDEIQPPENPFILMKKDFLEKTATILPKDIVMVEAGAKVDSVDGAKGKQKNDNDVDQQDNGNESSFKWRRQLFKDSRDSKKPLVLDDEEDGGVAALMLEDTAKPALLVESDNEEDDGTGNGIMENLDLSDDSSISVVDDVDNKSLMLTFSAANRDLDDTDLDVDSISNLEFSGRNTISNRSNFWQD